MGTDVDLLENSKEQEVGSYFVANYPPFSTWTAEHIESVEDVLDNPVAGLDDPGLGLYIHIPFCRTRCKFCYFRVYTDKNSRDVDRYLEGLLRELELYAGRRRFTARPLEFVYFGGGTPSFLSNEQLERLVAGIHKHWSWTGAREVTFECEPGTLKRHKLEAIRELGTTRLSLGVEHFDDGVLEINGRAHRSPEIFRAYDWAREVNFPQINIDLIAGMPGDTTEKWHAAVAEALALEPDSITIYQLEVPHNSLFAKDARDSNRPWSAADWPTKRAWVDYAFDRFQNAGYVVSSGYTMVKNSTADSFVYRDALWHGCDMLGTGVASFSYVGGVHFQNVDGWEPYLTQLEQNHLPIARALRATPHQRVIREFILQLKLGRLDFEHFRRRHGVEILEVFEPQLELLQARGDIIVNGQGLSLTRSALLRVDAILPLFFEPQFRGVRYS